MCQLGSGLDSVDGVDGVDAVFLEPTLGLAKVKWEGGTT